MATKRAVAFVVLFAVFAAGASEASEASLSSNDEPEDLRSLQADVRKVAEEIDGMHETSADDKADAMATGDLGDAAPTLVALPHAATPLEQLESADTASDRHIQQLTADTAAVQAQDTANDLEQEAESESDDRASKEDIKAVSELANNLKQSDLLPPGWEEKTDSQSGKNYYENKAAGKTTWDPPKSLVSIALAAARGQRDAQSQISSLKMKLEEMSSSKDLGEGAGVGSGCEKSKASFQRAAVVQMKQLLATLNQKLNLTGEQQKLLAEQMKQMETPVIFEPSSDHAKLQHKVIVDTNQKAAKASHQDLGESLEQDESANDRVAMVQAEEAARRAAQATAVKEAARLHDSDEQIQKQVAAAAQKKDRELAMQDEALEKSAAADDKLTAEIMGPKATKAEKREEKVLLGESTSNVDEDNASETESTEDLGESSSADEDAAKGEFDVSDDKDEFDENEFKAKDEIEAKPSIEEFEDEYEDE